MNGSATGIIKYGTSLFACSVCGAAEVTDAAIIAAFLVREGRLDIHNFLRAAFDEWSRASLGEHRHHGRDEVEGGAQHRFEWTMFYV